KKYCEGQDRECGRQPIGIPQPRPAFAGLRHFFVYFLGAGHGGELVAAKRTVREVQLVACGFAFIERMLEVSSEDVRRWAVVSARAGRVASDGRNSRFGSGREGPPQQTSHQFVVVSQRHKLILLPWNVQGQKSCTGLDLL